MALDESSRRFALLLQRDLQRLEDRERARADRQEEVRYDPVSRVATWETRRGDVVGRWYGESLATYNARDRILRWSWAFRATTEGGTHAELVFREGQSRDVPQLAMSVVNDVDLEDAMTLARVGAVASRADDIHVQRKEGDEDSIEIIGLFESSRPSDRLLRSAAAHRISVPPPLVAPHSPTPTPPSPPAHHPPAPLTSPPERERFLPLANLAITWISKRAPSFSQGLLVVTVDTDASRRHVVVQLVVIDHEGLLRALDPPAELLEAAAAMIGDARWRKLTARITPKRDGGATLHVDVI